MKSKDYRIKITKSRLNTRIKILPLVSDFKIQTEMLPINHDCGMLSTNVYEKLVEEITELVKIQTLIDYYNKLKDMFGIDMYPSDHLKCEIERLKKERELNNGY